MIHQLLARYGLVAVFFGAAVEGDVTMILAGVAAHLGLLDLPAALVFGTLGAVASDLACYALGLARASSIRRSALYKAAGPAIERFVDRIGVWQIATARFVYGTRIATMLFWGTRGLPLWRFLAVDFAGCSLWAVALGALGFLASSRAEALLGRVRRVRRWLLAALLVSAMIFVTAHLLFTWLRLRAARRAPSGRPSPP